MLCKFNYCSRGQLALNFYWHCEILCVSAADRSRTFDTVNFIVRVNLNLHTKGSQLLIIHSSLRNSCIYRRLSRFPPKFEVSRTNAKRGDARDLLPFSPLIASPTIWVNHRTCRMLVPSPMYIPHFTQSKTTLQ